MDKVVLNSRQMIRRGSRSFAAAARLFSPGTRHGAYLLYAWCRHCDDQIDGQELGMGMSPLGMSEQQHRLEELRVRTLGALDGVSQDDPIYDGLARIVREFRIPVRFPLALLDGLRMDVARLPYRALDDTLLYCYRVAGVVGVMMACVMGVRDHDTRQRAADLGIAFQLTNIARDVLDDAGAGRCYLPSAWLASVGLTPQIHALPDNRARLFSVVDRLLDEAGRYYASAQQGLRALPFRSAWAVATALGVYREIGDVVLRRGTAAWDQRAVVSTPRKLWHVLGGAGQACRTRLFSRLQASPPRDRGLWANGSLADAETEPPEVPSGRAA